LGGTVGDQWLISLESGSSGPPLASHSLPMVSVVLPLPGVFSAIGF
jgi:hypothetical protein